MNREMECEIYPYKMSKQEIFAMIIIIIVPFVLISKNEFGLIVSNGFELKRLCTAYMPFAIGLLFIWIITHDWYKAKNIKITVTEDSINIVGQNEYRYEWNELPYVYFLNQSNSFKILISPRSLAKNEISRIMTFRQLSMPVKSNIIMISFRTGGQAEFPGDSVVRIISEKYGISLPVRRNDIVSGIME